MPMMSRILCALLCAGAVSCSSIPTTPRYLLTPIDNSIRWDRGRATVLRTADSVDLELTSGGITREALVIGVHLTNRSSDTLLIEPRQNFYTFSYRSDTAMYPTPVFAQDPEEAIQDYEREIDDERHRHSRELNTQATVALLDLLVTTAGALTGADSESSSSSCSTDNSGPSAVEQEKRRHRQEIEFLTTARDFWEAATLRKTTVPPGATAKGVMVFRMTEGSRFLAVHVPVRRDTASVLYRVEVSP